MPQTSLVIQVATATVIGLALAQPTEASQSSELAKLRAENAKLKAEVASLKAQHADSSTKTAGSAADAGSGDTAKKDVAAATKSNRLFIRKDHFEAMNHIDPSAGTAGKGASVSYTQDYLKNAGALTVQAFGSYALIDRDIKLTPVDVIPGQIPTPPLELQKYVLAPFIYTNGTINSPAKPTEKSTLQVGIDNEFALYGGPIFNDQIVRVSPYLQTDFRGQGNIYGITTAWEPIKRMLGGHELNLGITIDNRSELVSLYWRLIGEANVFHVGDAGLSNWTSNTTYAQLGGKVALYGILFQNMPEVGPLLCGRIGFNTSYQYLWDPINDRPLHDYHAEIDYALGGKPAFGSNSCGASAPNDAAGTTSLALTYDNGTDKDSNETREQLKMALTYQY